MTRRRMIIGPDAEDDAKRIDTWWRENRTAAVDLFLQELDHALGLLAAVPHAGRTHKHRAVPGLRRYLLARSRYHVYYVTTDSEVIVIAVWGAVRGITPRFRDRNERARSTT